MEFFITDPREKNVELKNANWTLKIGGNAKLKIVNGQSFTEIVELKNAKGGQSLSE